MPYLFNPLIVPPPEPETPIPLLQTSQSCIIPKWMMMGTLSLIHHTTYYNSTPHLLVFIFN